MELIDQRWGEQLTNNVHRPVEELLLIAPFIKIGVLDNLIKSLKPKSLKVITRFNLEDFYACVCDTSALKLVLASGGEVRGISKLHSKLYIYDSRCAFITSANLTDAALFRGNHELGIKTEASDAIQSCRKYFDRLWQDGASTDLDQLANWDLAIQQKRSNTTNAGSSDKLPDHGSNSMFTQDYDSSKAFIGNTERAFVKFLGSSSTRCPLAQTVLDELGSSGCHWALGYPSTKRPMAVEEGSTIFISRLTTDGIRIFGRSIGHKFDADRDQATPADIAVHDWKKTWGNYIRVTQPQFLDGTMKEGVELNVLMDRFDHESFMSTLRNSLHANGRNMDPRKAFMKQPAVELTPIASAWLNDEFNKRLQMHGEISAREYEHLYNPRVAID